MNCSLENKVGLATSAGGRMGRAVQEFAAACAVVALIKVNKSAMRASAERLLARRQKATRAVFATQNLLITALALSAISIAAVGGTDAAASAATSAPKQISSEEAQNVKIRIKIAGKTLTATLEDNETARDFASLLPLNLSMNDLFGREKYGKMGRALSEKGPRTNTYQVGDIAYWSPAHDVAIYYREDSERIPSPGIIHLAKIDAGAEAFNVPGSVKVTIEVAK